MKVIKSLEGIKDGIVLISLEGCPHCAEAKSKTEDKDYYELPFNDDTFDIIKELGIREFPTTLVIKDGKIKRKVIGFTDTVVDYVDMLLNQDASSFS